MDYSGAYTTEQFINKFIKGTEYYRVGNQKEYSLFYSKDGVCVVKREVGNILRKEKGLCVFPLDREIAEVVAKSWSK